MGKKGRVTRRHGPLAEEFDHGLAMLMEYSSGEKHREEITHVQS